MNWLSGYHWKDFKYDGLAVNTQPILVGEDDLLFTDYDHVLACLKSPIPDLHKYSDLLLEFKQLHGHIDRYNEVVLVKCENRSCCNVFRSKVAKEILGAETRLPSPWRNRNLKGHYNAFLQEVLIMKKKFLAMKVNPQQWKKIFAGAIFVQIFFLNQQLKEQDIKACSITDKNKMLAKMEVSLSYCRLPIEFCIAAIHELTSNCWMSSSKRFASTVAGPF